MNTYNTLGHTQNQIKAVKDLHKAISKGEHTGAGLTISVCIGAKRDDSKTIDFTTSENTKDILLQMKIGLLKTLFIQHKLILQERKRLESAIELIDETLKEHHCKEGL